MVNEKRLIEVEPVIEKIRKANCADCYNCNAVLCRACLVDDFISLLDDSPAVDAVEVVRCKDCKKGHPELAPNGGVWCAVWNHVFRDDEFCSKGERKDNG